MQIILINGLIASGKTTLGKLLVDEFTKKRIRASFIDIDDEVLQINSNFLWDNVVNKRKDWLKARRSAAIKANVNQRQGIITVIAGPFFQRDEISGFVSFLKDDPVTFLFNLHLSLKVRLHRDKKRLHTNDIATLKEQEQSFELLEERYGFDINNQNSTEEALKQIQCALAEDRGKLQLDLFT